MSLNLLYRKAILRDLKTIIRLLAEDELGKTRERHTIELDQCYIDAFHKIDLDPNQYLMVVDIVGVMEVVGTCHLTIIPSLTFQGTTRMQIEAVRISEKYRGQNIGEWMIKQAIAFGESKGAAIIQLTTDKKRPHARTFYEKMGFEASHEGMKLFKKLP